MMNLYHEDTGALLMQNGFCRLRSRQVLIF